MSSKLSRVNHGSSGTPTPWCSQGFALQNRNTGKNMLQKFVSAILPQTRYNSPQSSSNCPSLSLSLSYSLWLISSGLVLTRVCLFFIQGHNIVQMQVYEEEYELKQMKDMAAARKRWDALVFIIILKYQFCFY